MAAGMDRGGGRRRRTAGPIGLIATTSAFGILACATPVAAQTNAVTPTATFDPNYGRSGLFRRQLAVAVADRPQPAYDPVPIPIGSFDLASSVSTRAGYIDNVFATKDDRRGDAVITLAGAADLVSDWSRNQLRFFARDDYYKFAKYGRQDVNLWGIGTTGRLDITTGSSLQAGGEYSRNVVSRTSSRSVINTRRQITYYQFHGFLGGTYGANRLRFTGLFDYRRQNYNSVALVDTAGIEDFVNRDLYTGTGRIEYAVGPSVSIFVQGQGNYRGYRNQPVNRPVRQSSGYEITAGSNFELSALLRGEVALGYIEQHYVSRAYQDYSGIAYHGRLQYFPTRLLTVTANADRTIEDSSLIGAGGFVANTYSLRADYELRRNIVLSPQIGFGYDKYQGFDLRYHRVFARADAQYSLSRHIALTFNYAFDKRNASGLAIAREFTVNIVQIGATYHF